MKATTLVILAAGMGSRFGGLKQLEPVTPEGEGILDFSIYDALRSGFSKIVFVVRSEILDDFKRLFDKKLEGRVDVVYVCQDDFNPVSGRTKPFGTGHAVLCVREAVGENFCMINADDFYSLGSFQVIGNWDASAASCDFAMVGFKLKNTLSDFGTVSRGQCVVDKKGFLSSVIERTGILSENGSISVGSDPIDSTRLTGETIVSMNFWGFTPAIFDVLERDFRVFLEENAENYEAEFYINDSVNRAVSAGVARVRVFDSNETWMGITYKNDKNGVAARIAVLREKGDYPAPLWQMKFDIAKIFSCFDVEGEAVECAPIASGHINDTFLIKTADAAFVLQRINHNVFKNPSEVVANKVRVVEHLKSKTSSENNFAGRMLTFKKTLSGHDIYVDDAGNSWNLMNYIEDSQVFLKSPNSKIAFEAGRAFGKFLAMTEDLDPALLHETLPRFHSMSLRYSQFDEALNSASEDRLETAGEFIEKAKELRSEMHILEEWIDEGTIPFRVTHNDTKISNALFSSEGKALCVIDLDTVMQGIVHYDFGDAVRTICGTADEDEPDISKLNFDFDYYESFVKGFVGASGIRLSDAEAKGLARSAKVMSFIVGLRFLTDFLNNDVYFDTRYETHNLIRARNQFHLVKLIGERLVELDEVVVRERLGRGDGEMDN